MFKILLSVFSIIIGTLLMNLGNGIIGPNMVLDASAQDADLLSVGAIPAAFGVGFIFGGLFANRIIFTFGHIRSFALFAAIITVMTLGVHMIDHELVWIVFRGVMGVAVAVMHSCSDSWVSSATPKAKRGQVMAAYAVALKISHFGAPAILGLLAAYGENPVLYATLFFIVSLIPVVITRIPAPEVKNTKRVSITNLMQNVPSSLIPVMAIGFANGSVLNLLPIYGKAVGFDTAQALLLLTVAHIGGMVFQWPMGWLSDRMDRRRVIAGILMSTSFISVFLWLALDMPSEAFMGLVFLWGAGCLSVYAVCLSHAVDHYEASELVPVCATLLMCWAIGAAVGPALAGFGMSYLGETSLFLFAAIAMAFASVFVIYRMKRTARRAKRAPFINVPVTGAGLFRIDPRRASSVADHVHADPVEIDMATNPDQEGGILSSQAPPDK